MQWSNTFATGIAELDEQHKTLFRMSEDYRLALTEGRGERVYGIFLQALNDYAGAHFGTEEQCMYRHRCPAAAKNSAAHADFVVALSEFDAQYKANGFTGVDAHKLVQYVDTWLADHIGRIDVQLKPCVEKSKR